MKRPLAVLATAVTIPVLAASMTAAVASDTSVPTINAAPSLTHVEPDFPEAATWAKRDEARDFRRATRNANGVRTYGTSFTAQEAAARLRQWARQGRGGYSDQCLRLADDAYGAKGPRTSTALSQWARAIDAGLAVTGGRDIPIGAQMFWRTSHSAGHIATYVGGGKVVTNMPGGSVELVEWRELNEWGPYLGWAPAYYR